MIGSLIGVAMVVYGASKIMQDQSS